MSNPLTHLIRYVAFLALGVATLSVGAPPASAAELRHTVAQSDLCRVNPIHHAPLRASKDGVIEADLNMREAIGAEVRARTQREAAEERYYELMAAYAPRADIRVARAYMGWARAEHELAEARLEQARSRFVLSEAELELGKLQLLEANSVPAADRYVERRFEDQLDAAQWDYDRAVHRVARLERRLAGARADWKAMASR